MLHVLLLTSHFLLQPTVWINELHAANDGPDTAEGVEVAGPAGTNLARYALWPYSGYGAPYDPASYGAPGQAIPLAGTLDDEGGSLGAAWFDVPGLRGGCQGIALTDTRSGDARSGDTTGVIVQFLSYGGCTFNATAGPVFEAADALGAASPDHPDSLTWATPITGSRRTPAQEWQALPPGYSLQLTGAGAAYTDFAWSGPLPASPGRLNDYQAPATPHTQASTPSHVSLSPVPHPLFPGLQGHPLLAALDRYFSPTQTLSYGRARDSLFVLLQTLYGGDSLRTLYADFALALPPDADPTQAACNGDGDDNPSSCNGDRNINTEHIWPQSRGTGSGQARADLHHLAPARADVNQARSNRPFGEVLPAGAETWYRGTQTTTAPPADPTHWARVDRDGAGTDGDTFRPRDAARGDVARALFYVRAVYPERLTPDDLAWFEAQVPTLLAWHAADPVDALEATRSTAIARWQGTENPFVLDETLARRAFDPTATTTEPSVHLTHTVPTLDAPYPNPSQGLVHTTLRLPDHVAGQHVRVTLLDLLGRPVATLHDTPASSVFPLSFDTASLPAGVYLLTLTTPSHPTTTHRLTVLD